MKKNRISTRIKDKTGIAKSKNRSEDLVTLRTQFVAFSKNLKFLITALTSKQTAMMAYSKSRLEVAKAVNSLTVDTPLFKCAGDIPANAVGTTDGGGDDAGSAAASEQQSTVAAYQANPTSYAAIHLQLHKKNKMYGEKYAEHILMYASEWERILSTRIAKHLKQAEKLRVDLDHYGRKVEDLNKTHNKTMSKGKSVGESGLDKLKRNEQKLVQARGEYDRFVNDLCGFMEEVMDRGWKDLHPLLVKMAQFDSTLSNEEASLLKGSMTDVTEQMKSMGAKYPNMKPAGRLKELETWSLESLNKVNPSMRSESPLMITQGGGDAASYVTGTGDTGGSISGIHAGLGGPGPEEDVGVGGGGLFGSGSSAGGGSMNQGMNRQMSHSSFGSNNGPPGVADAYGQVRSRNDTGESYDWANGGMAPGPGALVASNSAANMNQNQRSQSYRSPSSGGLPPLNPQTSFNRGPSFNEQPQRAMSHHDIGTTSQMLTTMQNAAPAPNLNDIFSAGGGVAPPPAGMPPPPPSMPPPVPQALSSPQMSQLSLYDGQHSNPHAVPPPPQGGMSPYMASPAQSHASATTNPFDDNMFGGGGGSVGMGSPMPPQPHGYGTPQQTNPYGGGGSTNPFG